MQSTGSLTQTISNPSATDVGHDLKIVSNALPNLYLHRLLFYISWDKKDHWGESAYTWYKPAEFRQILQFTCEQSILRTQSIYIQMEVGFSLSFLIQSIEPSRTLDHLNANRCCRLSNSEEPDDSGRNFISTEINHHYNGLGWTENETPKHC